MADTVAVLVADFLTAADLAAGVEVLAEAELAEAGNSFKKF